MRVLPEGKNSLINVLFWEREERGRGKSSPPVRAEHAQHGHENKTSIMFCPVRPHHLSVQVALSPASMLEEKRGRW